MKTMFAVYGPQARDAWQAIQHGLQGDAVKHKQALTQSFISDVCVLGHVANYAVEHSVVHSFVHSAERASGGENTLTEQELSGSLDHPHIPMLLHSRMGKHDFFRCNSASFGCKSAPTFIENLHTLNGDFTCMVVNAAASKLSVAVSAFNPQTVFYAKLCYARSSELRAFESTYVLCSSLEPLLELISAEPDVSSLAMWLAGRPDPNRSMYLHIGQVGQACVLELGLSAVHERKFWEVPAFAGMTRAGEVSEHLLALLKASVARYCGSSNEVIFTQLSGGMDSTSVSALAFNALPHPEAQLHSVSHTYANTQSCDETDNIQAMIARYDFAKSHFIELGKYTELSFSELYPTHPQSPGMVLSPKYHEEAKLMQAAGANVLLTGNGGDEMFWGHSFVYYDRLKKGDLSVLAEVVRGARELKLSAWRALRSVFLSPLLHYDILTMLQFANRQKALSTTMVERNLHIPPWLRDKSAELVRNIQYNMASQNPFASGKQGLTRYARYEGLFNTSTYNSMRSYQAVFDQYNLNVHHPLFDKHIAQFSFELDQHEHINGKYPKLLLRKAMSEYLPEQVCWNTHKTVFDQHFAKLVQQNRVQLRKLLEHEGLQNLGLVNNQKLLAIFDALVQSPKPSLNVDLLYAILVQSWYQAHIVKS
ncbi:asparagine synthase-related protein [Glaciecola siphonariae]|uniref:asparagine synthase (glutamine-hydrolyzing) n=1 Tax=Glaciecola siphonariae TaxID=521012 RepID=A0ABV9LX14_9ALTE